jgi:hypothetical protein
MGEDGRGSPPLQTEKQGELSEDGKLLRVLSVRITWFGINNT